MTSTSFNIKPPEKSFSARPTKVNYHGKLSTPNNYPDFIGQCSINFTIKQNNKFQPIFNSFQSKMFKTPAKSERNRFKPLTEIEISQIKLKIQQQQQKRRELSLNTILFSQRQDETEKALKRRPSSRYRPNTAHRSNKSPQRKAENQETFTMSKQKPEKEDEKILLESTNFTVKSYSWLNKSQEEKGLKSSIHQRKNSLRNSSLRTSKKGQSRQSNLLNRQGTKQCAEHVKTEEPEIEIRLSLKSMSRSEEGEKESPEKSTMQKWIMEEKKRLQKSSKSNLRVKTECGPEVNPQKVKRQILAGTTYKQNRMILKFDKRLLKSKTQVNNPCLKVCKISTITSRVKTEHAQN